MVRISDGRMSGTGFGTVILHVSPEAANGGVLGLVLEGDQIALDVANRRLDLLVSDEVLEERRAHIKSTKCEVTRGYVKMYVDQVDQANLGADMKFLKGNSGSQVTRDSH